MNTKRILCLVLALLMVFSLTACGGNGEGEEEIQEVIEYEYVSGQGGTQQVGPQGQGGQGGQGGGQGGQGGQSNQGGADASSLKGTTVRYATWKDPNVNEDGVVIENFEKETGITVKVDMYGESEYVQKLSGQIAANAGDIPDVFFCNETFPSCLKVLQPVTNAKINLSDPIWDPTFTKYFTIQGQPYLVNTVSNIWNETDMLFYNKKVLQQVNISNPDAYIQGLVDQGKWNYATLTEIMNKVKALGSSYIPAYMDDRSIICSTGANWLKYSNGKFSHGLDNTLVDATKQLATWKEAGLVSTTFQDMGAYFTIDKMAFCVTNAFGLKATGYFGGITGKKMEPNNIGFTYIPDMDASHKAVATGKARGYGLIKGAPNPLAAGVFLRYYLDVNNYDLSSTFISKKAEDFFFKVTTPERLASQNLYNVEGVGIEGTLAKCRGLADNSPSQVAAAVEKQIPSFTNLVNQINTNMNNDLAAR